MKKSNEIKRSNQLSDTFYQKVYVVLGLSLVLFALYNSFQISEIAGVYNDKAAEVEEASKPAEIQLVTISAGDCKDCYDVGPVVETIESSGVNIVIRKVLDFSSDEAKALVKKYGIKSVPTVVVTGELEKAKPLMAKLRSSGEEKDGAYIFTKLEPPYVDASSGKVKGFISAINLVKEDCTECVNLSLSVEMFKQSGVKFSAVEEIDIDSDEGRELVGKYNISIVPTLIMDQDAAVYPSIQANWGKVGTVEEDGYYVIRELPPPYYSVPEKKVRGIVSLNFLVDRSCDSCYNASAFHIPILRSLGVPTFNEQVFDVSDAEGKALVEKYNVESVPTVILLGDMEKYPTLANAWQSVGTIEPDGSYVFRNVGLAGRPYVDLLNGTIVDPSEESSDAGNETVQ